MENFDIGIIGGGPAGYSSALYAVKQNKSVILFEKNELGGTCLNKGCIPTKAFLHVADLYSEMLSAQKLGISFDNLSFDFEKISEFKTNIVNKLRRGLELQLTKSGIKIIKEEVIRFDKNTIQTNTQEYKFKQVINAMGSKPRELKNLPFDHNYILNSEDILNLKKLPKCILIVGSGAIGIEFARILSAFGVEVTIVELAERLTPLADWEVSKRIERMFKLKKIKTYLSTSVEKIENKIVYLSNGETITPECILVAIGRDNCIKEKIEGVNYIGDSSGEIQLAHYALSQAKNLVLNIPYNKNLIPSVIYGTPEIAWAGEISKNEEDDTRYDKVVFPISALGKAHCDNNIEGFIKILAKDNQIKGVSIISKEASSLIQQIIIAMQNNIPINKLKEVCFAHPTYSEIIQEGIMSL